jgi:hypothetical protein
MRLEIKSPSRVRVGKPAIVGFSLAAASIFSIVLFRTILEFIPSATGAVLTAMGTVAAGFVVVRWSLVDEPGDRPRPALLLILTLGFALVIFPILFEALPWGYTVYFGKPLSFETIVEEKIKRASFYLQIKESKPFYVMNPRIDVYLWNAVSAGDTIVVSGNQTLFGLSISHIDVKPRAKRAASDG